MAPSHLPSCLNSISTLSAPLPEQGKTYQGKTDGPQSCIDHVEPVNL